MTAPIGAYWVAAKMIMDPKFLPSLATSSSPEPLEQPIPKHVLIDLIVVNLFLWTAIITNIWWFS